MSTNDTRRGVLVKLPREIKTAVIESVLASGANAAW